MSDILKGFAAGLVATIVLSALMMMKSQLGMLPQLNVIEMLATVAGNPAQPVLGWIAHFAIGIFLWGGLFAIASDVLPGAYWLKGAAFGIAGWLLMGVVFFPAAGHGLFGLTLGAMVPVATAMLHLIYGIVLGLTYRALGGTSRTVDKLGDTGASA